jgi:hypothetical protein
MAKNSAGKWVARAGATGGGRTYRGQRPVNWYAALVVIVLLGILSVVFANYEYRHPASAATSTIQPTKGTTWYAGLLFNICGTNAPPLASNAGTTTSKLSFFTAGKGVITIAPKTTAEAGHNAVFGKFVSAYGGLTVNSSELVLPTASTTTTTSAANKTSATTTYKNGETCPKGTPDAGKKADVQLTYWQSALNSKGKAIPYHGEPADLRFTENQAITVGFVPPGTTLTESPTVSTALLSASTGASTTATTAPTTATTAPTTATTAPAVAPSSTTAPTTTTTAPKK